MSHKENFPILKEYVYLNTPSHGLLSSDLAHHRAQLLLRQSEGGSLWYDNREQYVHETRVKLAHFVGSDPAYTAFAPNFSYAFARWVQTIPKDKPVLMIKGDYPNLMTPLRRQLTKLTEIPLQMNIEEGILQAFAKEVPAFFCFSLVQYISGVQLSFPFLQELKHLYPDTVFVADLTQFIGAHEFDLALSPLDIICASCYKWMHAGDGNAFMIAKPSVLDQLNIAQKEKSVTPFEPDLHSPWINYFEPGHQDVMPISSLGFMIDYFKAIGFRQMIQQQHQVKQYALDVLRPTPYLPDWVHQREVTSTIFNLNASMKKSERLNRAKIITARRGGGLRMGISFFNTKEDIDQLIEVLG